jgi:hypothetical protein
MPKRAFSRWRRSDEALDRSLHLEAKLMRKRKKSKKLLDGHRLSLEAIRMIDLFTEDIPAVRPAMYEGMTAFLQRETLEVFARVGPTQRAGMLLAMRRACKALVERKSCDLCESIASKVRFVVVSPDGELGPGKRPTEEEALSVFTILCDRCVEIPPEQRDRKVLSKFARLQQQPGKPLPRRRPAVIGQVVGETTNLAARSALQSCKECGQSIWFDREDLERYGEFGHDAVFVCRNCAPRLFGTGLLESLPSALIGGARRDSD